MCGATASWPASLASRVRDQIEALSALMLQAGLRRRWTGPRTATRNNRQAGIAGRQATCLCCLLLNSSEFWMVSG